MNTHPALQSLARKDANHITLTCQGESEGFEIVHNGLNAFINYEAEYRDAIGGSYEGREFEQITELVRETVEVASVWDEDGNEYPELAEALQLMLNEPIITTMERNDLSTIMRLAWALMRSTGKAFAVCLAKAWQLYRLVKRMRTGLVSFCYEKADGTLRRAAGTLKEVDHLIKGTGRSENFDTVRYYDTEAGGFRSFRIENFITTY